MTIRTGDEAPDFTLTSHTGEEVSLSDFRGERPLVVFFYPRDHTPMCTKEACAFRDAYEDFLTHGVAVVGINPGSVESHKKFAENQRLPFPLLSDPGGKVRKAFGVPKTMGFLPGRVTYVIDKEGVVRQVFVAQMAAQKHVDEAMKVVREL